MQIQLLSYDLDGTLADTASEIAEAANRALASHGIARRPVSEVTHLIGAGTRELMLKLLARVFLESPAIDDRGRPARPQLPPAAGGRRPPAGWRGLAHPRPAAAAGAP